MGSLLWGRCTVKILGFQFVQPNFPRCLGFCCWQNRQCIPFWFANSFACFSHTNHWFRLQLIHERVAHLGEMLVWDLFWCVIDLERMTSLTAMFLVLWMPINKNKPNNERFSSWTDSILFLSKRFSMVHFCNFSKSPNIEDNSSGINFLGTFSWVWWSVLQLCLYCHFGTGITIDYSRLIVRLGRGEIRALSSVLILTELLRALKCLGQSHRTT